jgi:hypothetical protein
LFGVANVMKFCAKTLLNPWLIFSAWGVLWVGRLWLIPAYYQRTWELGYYPPEADSIAIPIAGNGIMTIVIAPFFAVLLWALLRRSPSDRRTWLAWDHKRWVISLVWTVVFAAFALFTLPGLREDIRAQLPINALADVVWFFLWLAVRAVVVSRIPPHAGDQEAPNRVAGRIALPAPTPPDMRVRIRRFRSD